MLADFVVLDRDLTKVAPPEILKTKVLRTVVGGKDGLLKPSEIRSEVSRAASRKLNLPAGADPVRQATDW